jgi:hypothetical protein
VKKIPNLNSRVELFPDSVGWEEHYPNTPITPVVACKINTGIVSANGVKTNLCAHIYVDDALLLVNSKLHILMKLTTLIEAIFVVMGKPDTTVRQCPLCQMLNSGSNTNNIQVLLDLMSRITMEFRL